MKKFEGILFCTDIDGTLVNSQNVISEENKKAIRYFMDNGGYFTACTGRQPRGVQGVFKELNANAPAICFNGAWIYDMDAQKDLRVLPLCDGHLPRILAHLKANEKVRFIILSSTKGSIHIAYNRDKGIYVNADPTQEDFSFNNEAEVIEYMNGHMIYKALFYVKDEDSDEVKAGVIEAFPDCAVHRSWIKGIEINVPGACKGPSARYVADLLGAKLLVCSGDYENDRTMIEEADLGYAVANAIPSLKAAADRIAPSCNDSAIAAIIYELERDIDEGKIRL